MKRMTLAILTMLLMLGVSMNSTASPKPTRCRVLIHVPFPFQVAARTLPAGYYQFEQILGNSDGVEVLVVRSLEDHQYYQAVATKAEKMDETEPASKLVFRHSGEKLVLAALCSHSKHTSMELYDAGTKQPMIAARTEGADDVELAVPADGELLAMARPTR
ncbi:MAG: hypothetical protein WB556_17170 [Candidatus Acidiferrum sp.]